MPTLELLAPARNADIGIAAICCGADAVYIGGPRGGARKDAGNPIPEIARLCEYAHRFGAKVFVTFNILLRDDELEAMHSDMIECQRAGADAFIIRDPRLAQFEDIGIPFHASTQCAIRTTERARLFEAAGCSRLTLERELSLARIRSIAAAVSCEIECFVHGALCVSYSGQCLMSEYITSGARSADRGECIQACRSLYNLEDASGHVLLKNKPLLSLRDLKLSNRLADLAEAGVTSFKIEGRLKSISYVRNVVRAYSRLLDDMVSSSEGKYQRASFGRVEGGFKPDLAKSFNRGYTELYIDGHRGKWAGMDSPKWAGEPVGTVLSVKPCARGIQIAFKPLTGAPALSNGDGFTFLTHRGIEGFRGDVCQPRCIIASSARGLTVGTVLYRNISASFEKSLDSNPCKRYIRVDVKAVADSGSLRLTARSEDGREVTESLRGTAALSLGRAEGLIRENLSKHSGIYSFSLGSIDYDGELPFLQAAQLNAARRALAERLDAMPLMKGNGSLSGAARPRFGGPVAPADSGTQAGELMRMKYCIRYELGLCPRYNSQSSPASPLYLINNGVRYPLLFDCKVCEMAVLIPTRN